MEIKYTTAPVKIKASVLRVMSAVDILRYILDQAAQSDEVSIHNTRPIYVDSLAQEVRVKLTITLEVQ